MFLTLIPPYCLKAVVLRAIERRITEYCPAVIVFRFFVFSPYHHLYIILLSLYNASIRELK